MLFVKFKEYLYMHWEKYIFTSVLIGKYCFRYDNVYHQSTDNNLHYEFFFYVIYVHSTYHYMILLCYMYLYILYKYEVIRVPNLKKIPDSLRHCIGILNCMMETVKLIIHVHVPILLYIYI